MKTLVRLTYIVLFTVIPFVTVGAAAEERIDKKNGLLRTYDSNTWDIMMNKCEEKKDEYPEKRKITMETIRLTLHKYYIPNVSEFLEKGVDYVDWINELDDAYLNRHKLDLKVDSDDGSVKLFWKKDF
ncbi:MAG: hypothetical protein HY810_07480 [Candidatus Omnitrophica bacterium]|nr:hypothetical protein [Candidatus Omnitrophota bacterium]